MPLPSDLATLTPDGGYLVTGIAASDYAGGSVAAGGDINGDGFMDFVVGAPGADPAGYSSGAAYVVFGRGGSMPPPVSLAALDGTNGFRLTGSTAYGRAGAAVAVEDVNNDGFADVIVGASGVGYGVGAAYVVYGKASGWAASLSLGALNGVNGFAMTGAQSGDAAGLSVAAAGDVNGDGVGDMLIGSLVASRDGGGPTTGVAWVVFGSAGARPASFSLAGLDGTNGFEIHGGGAAAHLGVSLASAGDFNGDGFDDIIVGADSADAFVTDSGAAYLIFGKASGWTASFDVASLDGSNGVTFTGSSAVHAGGSVASAGDFDGDGFDDVVIAVQGQASAFVVHGQAGGLPATVRLNPYDRSFNQYLTRLSGPPGFNMRVAGGGDINGDGFGDVLISDAAYNSAAGLVYVIYGTPGQRAGVVGPSAMIHGVAGDQLGFQMALGDVDGNGFAELLLGAARHGEDDAGAVYVLWDTGPDLPIVRNGTVADETFDGAGANDQLSGGGGKDQLNGLGGDDSLNGDDGKDVLNGGDGTDTLNGGNDNDILNGDAGDDTLNGDAGADKLNGGDGLDQIHGGAGADLMTGGDGEDSLDGGADNDNLDGGLGADSMTGGAGNDIYYVDDAGDTTVELAGQGTDIVRAATSWTLWDNVEQLELLGSDDLDATGNGLANRLVGNGGANSIWGNAGVDTIDGGAGADRIIGGTGNDLMTGGLGADTFVVLSESVYSSRAPAGRALEIDFVYDLNKAQGDRLDLSGIDANTATGADDAFHLVGAFTKHAGEMTLAYTLSSNQTVLSLDVDGDGKADYQMKLTGDVHADSGGWLL